MLYTGLVSVTFRQLTPQQIISLVVESGLDAIEWGGDIHVPPGNVKTANEVRELTAAAGLKVASYGSYYRVGSHTNFADVLESAVALGAPIIRVWAGDKGSEAADESWWETVIQDTRAIAEQAAAVGIRIGFEFHGHTLTDTLESALRLMRGVDHPNAFIYWQPLPTINTDEYLPGIAALTPWLANIHAYWITPGLRYPLEEGEQAWLSYLEALPPSDKRYVMLEFVKDDAPQQFLQDAAVLKRIVAKVNAAK